MIKRVARLLLSNPHIHAYFRRIYSEIREHAVTRSTLDLTVSEVTPISCRASALLRPRLNLFIPALSEQHVFGGIATALGVFRSITDGTEDARIVLTDESSFDHDRNAAFSGWNIGGLDEEDRAGRWIVPAGDRHGKSLCVRAEERFMASAWWTAVSIRNIRSWQAKAFPAKAPPRYVYLIQDYEPGFYPWSSRYVLAQSTYLETEGMIAVFNTSILRNFFTDEGCRFEHAFAFEPRINDKLVAYRDRVSSTNKGKIILVYGRPSVPRNAFELIVMGLRLWVQNDPNALDWQILSVGEPHASVELGRGLEMVSLGKLCIDDYAQMLLRSAIGLSLMISPHPSYPPLEMAAFGLKVITNAYKAKDLSQIHPNIIGMANPSPESIADALVRLTQEQDFAKRPAAGNDFWEAYTGTEKGYTELRLPIRALLGLDD